MTELKCPGFKAAGINCGIKKNNELDLGLILSESSCNAAAVFTKNKVAAAPVILSKKNIESGKCRAVIVNSGNANCATGENGLSNSVKTVEKISEIFNLPVSEIQIASTGVIGVELPVKKITDNISSLKSNLKDDFTDFNKAIMTTDKFMKNISLSDKIDNKEVHLLAIAKGAGMIRPDMATMLCYVVTDAEIDSLTIKEMLRSCVNSSFNKISVDGDTSTNDTVLMMAGGKSGVKINSQEKIKKFKSLLEKALVFLSKEIVRDGEGSTKVVTIKAVNAKTKKDASKIVNVIAHSMLVKTALFGEDPNWGRIIAAAGRSGADFDPYETDIFFDNICLMKKGSTSGSQAEEKVHEIMTKDHYEIIVDLNLGKFSDYIITSDLSYEYIKINADYRT